MIHNKPTLRVSALPQTGRPQL
jgi:hypothetical protein